MCRRVHHEATALHQAAYATYWAENVFRFSLDFSHFERPLTTKHIKHMTHIVQDGSFDGEDRYLHFVARPGEGEFEMVFRELGARRRLDAGSTRYEFAYVRKYGDWSWIETTDKDG